MPAQPDFWVATAGIAPVLALAHVVNVGRYLLWQNTVLESIARRREKEPASGKLSADFVSWRSKAMRSSNIVGVAIWGAILAAVVCLVALIQSLVSLQDRTGSHALATAVIDEVTFAFAVLVVGMAIEALARYMTRRLRLRLPGG